jgi:hypothetical protein
MTFCQADMQFFIRCHPALEDSRQFVVLHEGVVAKIRRQQPPSVYAAALERDQRVQTQPLQRHALDG